MPKSTHVDAAHAKTLKDASASCSDLPSYVTLKRMSAAGKLDHAQVGKTTGRYQTRLYDVALLRSLCNKGGDQRVGVGESPTPTPLPEGGRPAQPSAPSQLSGEEGSYDLHALQKALRAMAAQVDDLNATRRALQLKYDAENQSLRQQCDELRAEVRDLRTKQGGLDAARLLSKINQIASKLGC